jgi:hypothetical protein
MISLDFFPTFNWPSSRRWPAAKAETMWIAGLLPFHDRTAATFCHRLQ